MGLQLAICARRTGSLDSKRERVAKLIGFVNVFGFSPTGHHNQCPSRKQSEIPIVSGTVKSHCGSDHGGTSRNRLAGVLSPRIPNALFKQLCCSSLLEPNLLLNSTAAVVRFELGFLDC